MFRFVSLFIRRLQAHKSEKKVIDLFQLWKKSQSSLPSYNNSKKKLLIIRLDDIGDYLLFRNSLYTYKTSPEWKNYSITLLGNNSWKQLFLSLDESTTDQVLWLNKNEYLQEKNYRRQIWIQLRDSGFETVICPSCTRPLLLDDLCALATGAPRKIGSANTFSHSSWNELSDSLYTSLYHVKNQFIHEFFFNQHFANWCCKTNDFIARPSIALPTTTSAAVLPYILCFIGAASRSRRWPAKRWIEFIRLYKESFSYRILLAGGKSEAIIADEIIKETGVESIVASVSLEEMINYVIQSTVVITNNTMAAHLSASCNRPTIIIANGDNYIRFCEYAKAGIQKVKTLYPAVFKRWRTINGDTSLHYVAVTSDIMEISATDLLSSLKDTLKENKF